PSMAVRSRLIKKETTHSGANGRRPAPVQDATDSGLRVCKSQSIRCRSLRKKEAEVRNQHLTAAFQPANRPVSDVKPTTICFRSQSTGV
ncbi:hypothetical protein LH464_24340, partial [Neorhizobium sp. T786]|uniref:hypothetical protein n=1 Tax=Pseudorhizobium xiangyangii TaxID=2883104 RepID=UPI001CFFB3F9